MIRSSKPSPLKSPAEETEYPSSSPTAAPLMRKPSLGARLARSIFDRPAVLPNTTKAEPPPWPEKLDGDGAPMMMSASPSPLTSPAAETENPLWGLNSPSIRLQWRWHQRFHGVRPGLRHKPPRRHLYCLWQRRWCAREQRWPAPSSMATCETSAAP